MIARRTARWAVLWAALVLVGYVAVRARSLLPDGAVRLRRSGP